jgi:hypothetical protein
MDRIAAAWVANLPRDVRIRRFSAAGGKLLRRPQPPGTFPAVAAAAAAELPPAAADALAGPPSADWLHLISKVLTQPKSFQKGAMLR